MDTCGPFLVAHYLKKFHPSRLTFCVTFTASNSKTVEKSNQTFLGFKVGHHENSPLNKTCFGEASEFVCENEIKFEHLCNICTVTQKSDLVAHFTAKKGSSSPSVPKSCRCTTGSTQTGPFNLKYVFELFELSKTVVFFF